MNEIGQKNKCLINNDKSQIKQREAGIELLRVVLMFMIVCFHLFSFYIQETFYVNQPLYITKLAFTCLTVMGVDCFVFISGYFGMKFKLKQVISLVIQALFYSYICLILFTSFSNIPINNQEFIKYFFPISSSMWWFLSAYILLYFISPFINIGINNISKNQFQIILIGFFYFNCISNFIFDLHFGGDFLNFIFIYLLGRYINTYQLELKKSVILFLFSVIIMFLLNYLIGSYSNKPLLVISRYTSPLTIFSAVSLFFVFKNLKIKYSWPLFIAPLCFGVYLLHFNYFTWNGIIHPILFKIDAMYSTNNLFYFILSTIGLAIVIFILCLFVEKIRQIICKPILNIIEKKIDKLKLNI